MKEARDSIIEDKFPEYVANFMLRDNVLPFQLKKINSLIDDKPGFYL